MFAKVFCGFLPDVVHFWSAKNQQKKVSSWEQVLWEIGTVLILVCSGILVLWYLERVLMGSDAGYWKESVDDSF